MPVRRRFRPQWIDVVSFAIVAIVVYKFLIAPRIFTRAGLVAAPSFTTWQVDGVPFALKGQRGSVVFLDFFASWCGPCRLSLPLVEGYARSHPGSRVYLVDVGEPLPVVRGIARELRLDHVLLDNDEVISKNFAIDGFPTIVVVDPAGYVRAKWWGFNPAIAAAMANAQQRLAKD